MRRAIAGLVHLLRNEKKKMAFFLSAVIFWIIWLFPYGDLSDLVSSQIAKATNNQVFLQFSDPGFSIFPNVGFQLNDVHVETMLLPPLTSTSLTISPSIKGLLTFKPGVSVSAKKLLGGDADLSIQKITFADKEGGRIQLDTENIEIKKILDLFPQLSFPAQGKIKLDTQAEFESEFVEQPKAQINLQIQNFDLGSATLATAFGPLNLPSLALSRIQGQGNLENGRFVIDQLEAGQANDELSASVKGRVDLRVSSIGGTPQLLPGSYDLEIRLNSKSSFQQKASLFLSFISSYQKPGPNGSVLYSFRIRGQNFNATPNITAL